MRNEDCPTRQQSLPFEKNDQIWTVIPKDDRERCRSLCIQLLGIVLKKLERSENERQD